jgi:hypothetical protein
MHACVLVAIILLLFCVGRRTRGKISKKQKKKALCKQAKLLSHSGCVDISPTQRRRRSTIRPNPPLNQQRPTVSNPVQQQNIPPKPRKAQNKHTSYGYSTQEQHKTQKRLRQSIALQVFCCCNIGFLCKFQVFRRLFT